METNNVLIIYSQIDEANILPLINDIHNVTRFPLDQSRDQLDEPTKSIILKCNIFVCCLSTNCSQLFLDIVKFAHYVARKEINAYYIQPDKFDDFLKDKEVEGFSKAEKAKAEKAEAERRKKKSKSTNNLVIHDFLISDLGIQNFFNDKTNINRITSLSDLKKVNFLLELIFHFLNQLNNYMFIPCLDRNKNL